MSEADAFKDVKRHWPSMQTLAPRNAPVRDELDDLLASFSAEDFRGMACKFVHVFWNFWAPGSLTNWRHVQKPVLKKPFQNKLEGMWARSGGEPPRSRRRVQ